jgi:uncharacterized protein
MRQTTLAVMVKPSVRATDVSFDDGMVTVRVKEPAQEGRANEACRKALAKSLGVAPSAIKLLRGTKSRLKVFILLTLTLAEASERLSRLRS